MSKVTEHLAQYPVDTLDGTSLRGLRDLSKRWLEKNATPELRTFEEFKDEIAAEEAALASIERELNDRAG